MTVPPEIPDPVVENAAVGESAGAENSVREAAVADPAAQETFLPGTAVRETAMPGPAGPGSAVPDPAVPPTATPDAAVPTPSEADAPPHARVAASAAAEAPPPLGAEAEAAQTIARTRLQRFRAWRFAPVVEIVATIAFALVLAESVQAAVVKPFVIPSASMEPTLAINQRVLVNRLAYDFSSPQRGDIVVFHPPDSLTCPANVPSSEPCPRSNPRPASEYFVKRVIGLPGDRIALSDGHPVINGKKLAHESYIRPCDDPASCDFPHAITVPRGEYFLLGDNRGDSDDSRYWGPIPGSWIIGQVFATYWPIDRIGIF